MLALCVVAHPAPIGRHCGRRGCSEIWRAHILPKLRLLCPWLTSMRPPNSNRPGSLARWPILGSIWPRGRLFGVYGVAFQVAWRYSATSISRADSEYCTPYKPPTSGAGCPKLRSRAKGKGCRSLRRELSWKASLLPIAVSHAI